MKLATLSMMLLLGLPTFANATTSENSNVVQPMGHHGGVRCGARNARGAVYWETGLDAAPTLARAMARCQIGSIVCRPLGCKPN